jgi:hypothetical protein
VGGLPGAKAKKHYNGKKKTGKKGQIKRTDKNVGPAARAPCLSTGQAWTS